MTCITRSVCAESNRKPNPRITWLVATALQAVSIAAVSAQSSELVSTTPPGFPGIMASFDPDISGSGRFVVFHSRSPDFTAGDANAQTDVFMRDRAQNRTVIVSRTSNARGGIQGIDPMLNASISGNGQFVVFETSSELDGPGNPFVDIFLRDLDFDADGILGELPPQSETTLISACFNPAISANGESFNAVISESGVWIAFETSASNITAPGMDVNGATRDILVRPTAGGPAVLISLDTAGLQGPGFSITPSISASGRFVAFVSENPFGFGGPAGRNVFLHDRDADQDGIFDETGAGERRTQLVSAKVGTNGMIRGNAASDQPSVSADGSVVAYSSLATDLDPVADTCPLRDVFRREMGSAFSKIVSINDAGLQGVLASRSPAISGDGRVVTFASENPLGPLVTVGSQIWAFDHIDHTTRLLSVANTAAAVPFFGNADSSLSSVSEDGQYVAFDSMASNLIVVDPNAVSDVFVRDQGPIVRCSGCFADVDGDGDHDSDDINEFFLRWDTGAPCADADGDGDGDSDDITIFFASWDAGNC